MGEALGSPARWFIIQTKSTRLNSRKLLLLFSEPIRPAVTKYHRLTNRLTSSRNVFLPDMRLQVQDEGTSMVKFW